ncbi:MAG: hypothetical protein II278_01200 [Bacteroidaceae bacterium]|jgi:hypothetical protein|nr:hypothetical protein [Bacteroidaceae bacterium]
MNKILTTLLFTVFATLPISLQAQKNKDWTPTGVWPFINQQFRAATVYTGVFNRSKTVVPCNIHVGSQTLWYNQNDTLMEAIPGSVVRVEFPNGDRYMPVGNNQFGLIVKEDSIDGTIARIILVRALDQNALDQKYVDHLTKSQSIYSEISDAEAGKKMEEEPLPLVNVFYFQVRSEIFQATSKNILTRINPKRKKEFRTFRREAEIISTNESSMLKIWNEYFLKY